jgi:protein TonB
VIFQSLAGNERAGRSLARALALSLVLHMLVLWPMLPPRSPQPAVQPLAATLRAAAVPESKPAAAVAAPHRIPQPRRTQDVLHRLGDHKPAVIAQPAASQAPALEAASGSAAVSANRNQVQLASLGAASAAGVPAPETEGLDAEGVRAYRMGLARAARAYKRYPGIAQERGWAGTAEVRIAVSREGRPRQIFLERSSGHEALDHEAVDMMSRAAVSAPVPESLRGREFAVSLPVLFDLAGQQ